MDSAPQQAEADVAAESKLPAALRGVGLATASTVVTLAVSEPPPGFDRNLYTIAISGAFFAGVAELSAAVWVSNDPRDRSAAGRKFVYASVAPLVVAVVLSVASLLS